MMDACVASPAEAGFDSKKGNREKWSENQWVRAWTTRESPG